MSDNPYAQPQDAVGHAEYLEPKTSIMAVFAFVVSIVGLVACCIPGVGPLGLLLGVVALILISTSGGRKKGTGLAIAAIVMGLIAGAINIAVVIGANAAGREFTALGGLVEAANSRDLGETQTYLNSSQSQQLTQPMLDAWADALNADYGPMQPRPTGLIDLIGQYAQAGQGVNNIQLEAQREYPSTTHAPIPIALPFDNGTVVFIFMMPQGAPGLVGSIENVAFEAADGSVNWLLPPPSAAGQGPGSTSGTQGGGSSDDAAGESSEAGEPGEG